MKFFNTKALIVAMGLSTVAFATPLASVTSTNSSFLVNDTAAILPGGGVNGLNAGGNSANPGQLYSLTAFGYQVYDVGDAVHNSGAILGNDISSFSSNYIGSTGTQAPSSNFSTTSAANVAGVVTTAGVFSGIFGNVAWTKTYRYVSPDVIEEVYTVQNNGASTLTNFRGFAAYDADQFSGGSTTTNSTNSTGTTSGYNYALSSFSGLNVVLASRNAAVSVGLLANAYVDPNCIVALAGGPVGGCGGGAGNTLVNGTVADRALAYVFNIGTFAAGTTQSFTVYQLLGNNSFNLANALAALPGGTGSSSSGGGVPEPGSLFLMGSACVALGVVARRRAKSNS